MEELKAPEEIYILPNDENPNDLSICWYEAPYRTGAIEYVRTDAFIKKAAQFLYNYNQKQVLKHGARATLGCGEYTINVDEFEKYMKGE